MAKEAHGLPAQAGTRAVPWLPAHLQAPSTYSAGQMLSGADVVALTGQTGRRTGPHLHLGRFVPNALNASAQLVRENARVPCVP